MVEWWTSLAIGSDQKTLRLIETFGLNTYIKPGGTILLGPITRTYLKQVGHTNGAINTLD